MELYRNTQRVALERQKNAQRTEPTETQWLFCPACGRGLSAEDRVLWQNDRVAACPACMKEQGFALRRML